MIAELQQAEAELRARGYHEDASRIEEAERELEELESPSFFGRVTAGAREAAMAQWQNVVGELQETKETLGLLRRGLGGDTLTPGERDKVKSQLLDLFRVVPAATIAVANSAFPIPGTGVFTPLILKKLGLLPSRWREAHALETLVKEQARLKAIGQVHCAQKLAEAIRRIEEQIAAREEAEASCALLTHWDADGDGQWSDEERRAYAAEVERLTPRPIHEKRWFIQYQGHVFGPLRLEGVEPSPGVLVSWDGRSGWVSLEDLLARSPG